MNDSTLCWLWLSSLTEINPNAKAALLKVFGTAKAAFHAPHGAFAGVEGLSKRDAQLLEARDLTAAQAIPDLCKAAGASFLTPDDDAYPNRLREIYAPPPVLYVRGHLPDLGREVPVAVIGTRHASPYGLKMGRNLAYELVKCKAVVVSGLTAGIDAAAAEGALAAGGVCIGVLGTPIDAAKNNLAERVLKKGALISEYPPGTPQLKTFFRARNRIAAGISEGVVVVEAPEKSGTRLFVAEALEQGKEVFAVPGNADSDTSSGTIRFLREGAQLVTRGWEVAEELTVSHPGVLDPSSHESFPQISCEAETPSAPVMEPSGKERKKKISKKRLDKPETPCYIDITDAITNLSDVQKKIVLAVVSGHSSAEEIIACTALSASTVLSQLTILEIRGILQRDMLRGIIIKS